MPDNPPIPPPVRYDSSWFKPGTVASRSGVYRVHHYAHRMPHTVIVLAGTVLPPCSICGDMVQFAPLIAAEPLDSDLDFLDDNVQEAAV